MKKKSNIRSWFGSGKWFWLSIIVHVAVAAERQQQPCAQENGFGSA
jgi:hypothetical protein